MPQQFDLVRRDHALPRRHLVLAVEDRIFETGAVGGGEDRLGLRRRSLERGLVTKFTLVTRNHPHTHLRAKLLASTDVHGSFAGIPIVVQAINAVNQTAAARSVMEGALGVDKKAWLPSLATRKFRSGAPESRRQTVRDGEKTPGKVARNDGDVEKALAGATKTISGNGPISMSMPFKALYDSTSGSHMIVTES